MTWPQAGLWATHKVTGEPSRCELAGSRVPWHHKLGCAPSIGKRLSAALFSVELVLGLS